MGLRTARFVFCLLLLALLSMGTSLAGTAAADTAGTVHYLGIADSSFDQFTSNPDSATKEWFDSHMWRMVAYSPYFDSRTSWYTKGWVYDDSYAIYNGSSLASQHPEWILKDAAGNPLYIPSGCSDGTCPQFAGDISNRAFRAAWIKEAKAEVAQGYKGIFVDDVNMEMQVSNGDEQAVTPIDHTTGKPMTSDAWRSYMAQFMQEVRTQLPNTEIAHNVIWYADNHAGISNPSIRSEIESANYIFLERGANDSGLTGGEGSWSLNALLAYIDQVHSLGRNVVLDGTASDTQGLTYNLASYFLISNGQDAVRGDGQTPESWWSGWSESLGEASGPRYTWNHLLRRDFANGMALVNPPGEPAETVSLPVAMQNAEGETVTSVTLPPSSGAILTTTPPVRVALSDARASESPSAPAASLSTGEDGPAPGAVVSADSSDSPTMPVAGQSTSVHGKHASNKNRRPRARAAFAHTHAFRHIRGRSHTRWMRARRRHAHTAGARRRGHLSKLADRHHHSPDLARTGRN